MDREIAVLAARQHGVVSREQLEELGLDRGAIWRRIDRGWLHVVHQGVYAVGHPALTDAGRWMAAVLASGPDAVLSHRSAAALWEIGSLARVPETIAPRTHRTRPGLRIHHAALESDEIGVRRSIPVTSPARTLLDFAAVAERHELRSAWREAEFRRLATLDDLDLLLCRYPGRRGIARLRATVSVSRRGERLRSDLEARFRRMVVHHGLPRPKFNETVRLGREAREWDAVWHDALLLVELDGRGGHETVSGFARDRERDREAILAGWLVIRVTWEQIGPRLARDLATLIATRRAEIQMRHAMRVGGGFRRG